jgi:tetratricopeptide (TPR) repeat protein
MASPPAILAAARHYHQAGDVSKAEQLCRDILEAGSSDADVWYLHGLACKSLGRLEEAVGSFRQAVALQPSAAEIHNSLGIALVLQRQLEEAAASFRRAAQIKPDYAQAHTNLGNVLKEQGKLDQALPSYERAVQLKPDFAEAHNNLGSALKALGKLDEAIACYRQAIALKTDYADTHVNLGGTLAEQGKLDEAMATYRHALTLRPEAAEVHNGLGIALVRAKRLDEAVSSFRQAVQLRPNYPQAHNNLANALKEQGNYAEAQQSYLRTVQLDPQFADAHNNLGLLFAEQGRLAEALASYGRALQLRPDFAVAHKNRSLVWLQQGKFAEGWAEYEWRWQCPELPLRRFPKPQWDGSPLAGRTIMLHAEQGLGDTLQFIRYVPLVKQRGARVIVVAQKALLRLLKSCPGIDDLMAQGDPIPPFDVHAPLLSLPRLFDTLPATIPARGPYLFAEPPLVERLRQELGPTPGFRIGIAWRGSRGHALDRYRSFAIAQLEPIAEVPGVRLFSLQKEAGSEEVAALDGRFAVTDLGPRLDDFADTAAVMKNLDMVISTDTSVLHLAGALAMPAWGALAAASDWRWLLEREDSPWYPTLRLFRQARLGDWPEVFVRMAGTLREQLAASPSVLGIPVDW